MRYELQPWETLINSAIRPENLNSSDDSSLQEILLASAEQRDHLRSSFIEKFYAAAKRKKLAFYIPFNQHVLTRLLDKVHNYKNAAAGNTLLFNFYDTIIGHISSVLNFIEEYFEKYFDQAAKLPELYAAVSLAEIRDQLELLSQVLNSRKEIDGAFTGMLLKNFNDFCERAGCSYDELIYQKNLLKELLDLRSIPADIDCLDMLHEVLVYMNFNLPAFIIYYSRLFRIGVKPDRLREVEQQLILMTEKPGMALRAGAPSVKASLLLALEKEKSGGFPVKPMVTEFVSVPFKGSEIYLLHKSFIDAGGAPHEIYKTLLEKTAASLGNKTQKGFSAESLVKYSDKVDPQSKDNVKRFLQKMIRNIESYD